MTLPVIVIGAGGHAKVVLDTLLASGRQVIGLTEADPAKHGQHLLGVPILGGDDRLAAYPCDRVELLLGLGSVGDASLRRKCFLALHQQGYRFATAIHPAAHIAREVSLGQGTVIMAGAILQPGCQLGENVIINTGARLDHDCRVGDHAHISPGAVLCGEVQVAAAAHIGAGATIIQGINIGEGSLVGAGAAVVRSVPAGRRVTGVPAAINP